MLQWVVLYSPVRAYYCNYCTRFGSSKRTQTQPNKDRTSQCTVLHATQFWVQSLNFVWCTHNKALYCRIDALQWYNLCQDLYQLKADHLHPNWVACTLIGSLASYWGRCLGARVKVRCTSHIAASPLYKKYYIYLWLLQHSLRTLINILKAMRRA